MDKPRNHQFEPNDFFEELGLNETRFEHYETLKPTTSDDNSGLSQENVHKLTEDLLNPLSPEDSK